MTYFLEDTAGYLIDHFGGDTSHVCVVLPSRRAGLFLKKFLAQQTEKPMLAPAIYSIEDFVYRLTGLQKAEAPDLLFDLYEVYKQCDGKQAVSFTEFLKWAEVVLHDFNDADLSLADPDALFGYLSESKALSLWNLDEKPLTEFELKYLHFFSSLKEYYKLFHTRLISKGWAYQGMAYRQLHEKLGDAAFDLPWKKIVFAGFNALSAAEESIIKQLLERRVADLLWDADSYYMDDKRQEAGHFLRHNKKSLKLQELEWTGDHLLKTKKKIHLIGVPRLVGQAKVAGQLLGKGGIENTSPDRTSVVLNDEAMLSPLLNSLPLSVKTFNLTMGLPLKNTVLQGLVDGFLTLNLNALRFPRGGDNGLRFYYKDLVRVLDHPYLSGLAHPKGSDGVSPAQKITSGNQVFYSPKDVQGLFSSLGKNQQEDFLLLFKPWENNPTNAINDLLFLLKKLKFAFSEEAQGSHEIDLEYIFHYSKLFNKLQVYFTQYPFLNDLAALDRLLKQLVRSVTIPFYGEPLMGVQIMGMLETRTLDFDRIIMLSVNEDFLPGGAHSSSFIPFDIRKKFRLPTQQERHAVAAYHFYRLLQRAKEVYLVYNTEAGDLGGGDRSRFIAQMEHELTASNPEITITSEVMAMAPEYQKSNVEIVIEKNSEILEALDQLTTRGISASALNTYRNCSLQFYFKYIAGISESDEVEETIEASTLGTVVHEALQQLYMPQKGLELAAEALNGMKPLVVSTVAAAFRKYYETGDIRYGKNLLIAKVAEAFVSRFISAEQSWLKKRNQGGQHLRIKGLELKLEEDFEAAGCGKRIKLKGFIDRVEELAGSIRIVDYKTGRVESRDLKLKEWDEFMLPGRHDKVFQLLFYSMLYSLKGSDTARALEAGIYSFRNLGPGLLTLQLPDDLTLEDSLPRFRDVLDDLFSGLFDPKAVFRQTEELNACEYCSFKNVCNR